MTKLTARLARANTFWLSAYTLAAAFSTYFCMYAFRKPFAVASYDDIHSWTIPIDFKIMMILSQLIGYWLSKFIGIKVVTEAKPERRGPMILALVVIAWFSLILFAIIPSNIKFIAMFFNGLPLGMIWGLVFAYVEGRRTSEVLGAGLCVSFIVSSGAVKSVGDLLMENGVSDLWMPAVTGAIFLPLLAISVYFLSQTPLPNKDDIAERLIRSPMTRDDRIQFLIKSSWGLVALIITYVMLTLIRDFRDNFAPELWDALGFANEPGIFTYSELPVALIVLLFLATTMFIKNGKTATLVQHGVIIFGGCLLLVCTLLFHAGLVSPLFWMIAVGVGTYIAYVPFNCILVDRLTGAMKLTANAAFFIYVADSSGYLGSLLLLLFKNFGEPNLSWLNFFIGLCYISSAIIIFFSLFSFFYFKKRLPE